jgi:hypothetical protein
LETTLPTGYPPPVATHTQVITQVPKASQTEAPSSPTPTATNTFVPAYPGVTPSPTFDPGLLYPGPGTPYYPAYPAPEFTSTFQAYLVLKILQHLPPILVQQHLPHLPPKRHQGQ